MNQQANHKRTISTPFIIILLAVVILFFTPAFPSLLVRFIQQLTLDKISLFATIFLGIFIEATPFLLLGTLASGAVEVFVNQDILNRYVPKNPLLGALAGGFMGLFFPVCECGVVPLTRRMFRKGLPLPAGIAFLLAGPVLNPVVIFSTATAFGFGKVLLLRIVFSLLIAVITGVVFAAAQTPREILKPTTWTACRHDHTADAEKSDSSERKERLPARIGQVILIAQGEFFEMGKYLVIGGLIAAGMQTFVAQTWLTHIAQRAILSVLGMMILAVILSICSTVDSFVALGFVNTFSMGSILGFLVFGPMVDIKSALMYWRVFRGRAPFYLILIPFILSLLLGSAVNILMG
jgi:uncharacterized membrane protein YraQ (UPF0718 family)